MRRTGWRLVNGRWVRSLREPGVRVRLFQKRKSRVFYRFVRVPGVGPDRKALGTGDQDEADRLGARLPSGLLVQEGAQPQRPVLQAAGGSATTPRRQHSSTTRRPLAATTRLGLRSFSRTSRGP